MGVAFRASTRIVLQPRSQARGVTRRFTLFIVAGFLLLPPGAPSGSNFPGINFARDAIAAVHVDRHPLPTDPGDPALDGRVNVEEDGFHVPRAVAREWSFRQAQRIDSAASFFANGLPDPEHPATPHLALEALPPPARARGGAPGAEMPGEGAAPVSPGGEASPAAFDQGVDEVKRGDALVGADGGPVRPITAQQAFASLDLMEARLRLHHAGGPPALFPVLERPGAARDAVDDPATSSGIRWRGDGSASTPAGPRSLGNGACGGDESPAAAGVCAAEPDRDAPPAQDGHSTPPGVPAERLGFHGAGGALKGFLRVTYVPLSAVKELAFQGDDALRLEEVREAREERERDMRDLFRAERIRALEAQAVPKFVTQQLTIARGEPSPQIQFVMNRTPMTVREPVASLLAGDQLVSVNGVGVLDKGQGEIIQLIRGASFPKTLAWRRPAPDSPEDIRAQLGMMRVTGPRIARRCVPFRIARFALPEAARAATDCAERPLILLSDRTACRSAVAKPFSPAPVEGSVVLVSRGFCRIADKVKRLQEAGARAVVVIDAAEQRRGAGRRGSDADDGGLEQIKGNAWTREEGRAATLMISGRDGDFLERVAATIEAAQQRRRHGEANHPALRVVLGHPGLCPIPDSGGSKSNGRRSQKEEAGGGSDAEAEAERPKAEGCPWPETTPFRLDDASNQALWQQSVDASRFGAFVGLGGPVGAPRDPARPTPREALVGGTLLAWSGGPGPRHAVEVPYRLAWFGRRPPRGVLRVVVARADRHGCKRLPEMNTVRPPAGSRGAAVVVAQGRCAFEHKAATAKQHRATVVIVVGAAEGAPAFRMPLSDLSKQQAATGGLRIDAAALMVTAEDGARLSAAIDALREGNGRGGFDASGAGALVRIFPADP
jgi:hypothetical protein